MRVEQGGCLTGELLPLPPINTFFSPSPHPNLTNQPSNLQAKFTDAAIHLCFKFLLMVEDDPDWATEEDDDEGDIDIRSEDGNKGEGVH